MVRYRIVVRRQTEYARRGCIIRAIILERVVFNFVDTRAIDGAQTVNEVLRRLHLTVLPFDHESQFPRISRFRL